MYHFWYLKCRYHCAMAHLCLPFLSDNMKERFPAIWKYFDKKWRDHMWDSAIIAQKEIEARLHPKGES